MLLSQSMNIGEKPIRACEGAASSWWRASHSGRLSQEQRQSTRAQFFRTNYLFSFTLKRAQKWYLCFCPGLLKAINGVIKFFFAALSSALDHIFKQNKHLGVDCFQRQQRGIWLCVNQGHSSSFPHRRSWGSASHTPIEVQLTGSTQSHSYSILNKMKSGAWPPSLTLGVQMQQTHTRLGAEHEGQLVNSTKSNGQNLSAT